MKRSLLILACFAAFALSACHHDPEPAPAGDTIHQDAAPLPAGLTADVTIAHFAPIALQYHAPAVELDASVTAPTTVAHEFAAVAIADRQKDAVTKRRSVDRCDTAYLQFVSYSARHSHARNASGRFTNADC